MNLDQGSEGLESKRNMDMDAHSQFYEHVTRAAEEFKAIDKKDTIRLVSHLDADGITSCALLVKLLNIDNRTYSLSVVQQLKVEVLKELALEPYKVVIFSDLASGMLEDIRTILKDKKVFIVDHHEYTAPLDLGNVTLVNPHMFGIDGGKEVSGAGVSYLFSQAVDSRMQDFAHIAIVGAIGDMQERNGFERINNEILQTAIEKGKIKVIRGLRMFGAQTKPLHKILEYSTDPYIPGVSGSESGAIQFLHQCGINPKSGSGWKKVKDLSEEDMKNMVTGVIMRRLGEGNTTDPADVLGNVYLLRQEEEGSSLKDAKEFATLLNACGRLGKASLGVGACIGDKTHKQKAIALMSEYKREIVNAMNWYETNKESGDVEKGAGYLIINVRDKVLPTIVGTMGSIISRGNDVKAGTYILSLAQLMDGSTKVSLRMAGRDDPNTDLKGTMDKIVEGIDGCEAGGHQHAAGAVFPSEMELTFLENARRVLGNVAMEEKIS
jgi:single-stranded-DNA-specific exonuclease